MTQALARLTTALADRYRIERELGVGGMATVYLAHDLKHEREVAIKVLHPDLGAALGGERFLSEIKTTAKLQHPHILPLLDSGAADGLLYYVMPYVAGETLRSRLSRERQLPIDDAIRVSREVADALGAAHALGIIHRDIKPENILLQGGHALVADFGIALAVQSAGGARMTQTGLSLGTPQYMSPEQATGEKVIDARSDIYALGAVTYEMLVGEAPFTGPSVQAIVARVLTEEPRSIALQRKAVSESVESAVMRALEKLPADRFSSAAEFVTALAVGTPAVRRTKAAVRGNAERSRALTIAAVVLTAMALAAGWLLGRRTNDTARGVALGSSVMLPDSTPLEPRVPTPEGLPALALSPDATQLVFVGHRGAGTQLFVRRLDQFIVRPLEGTEGGSAPFFSPSGDAVLFFADNQLKRLSLGDGRVSVVKNTGPDTWGGAWLPDGRLVITKPRGSGLVILTASGDSVGQFNCRGTCTFPEPLPDGQHLLSSDYVGLGVFDMKTARWRTLKRWDATSDSDAVHGLLPRYDGDGHLVWVENDGQLMAAPFDAEKVAFTGPPMSLASGVRVETGRGGAQFALSRSGLIAFAPGPLMNLGILVRSDRHGKLDTIPAPVANYLMLELSPDGRRLLTFVGGTLGDGEFHIIDVMSGRDATWGIKPGQVVGPRWTADSRHIAFTNASSAFIADPDVDAPPEKLSIPVHHDLMLLADGKRYVSHGGDTIYIGWVDGSKKELPLVTPSIGIMDVSPDGDWAVQQEMEGRNGSAIVARALDGSGRRVVIPNSGGFSMVDWRPGTREFFVGANKPDKADAVASDRDVQEMWSVSYDAASKDPFSAPRHVFNAVVADFPGRNYASGPGGNVFVFKQHVASAPPREVRLLTNWHQRLAPASKTGARP